MKKGQLLSQPFVWIFALILGALIMVWGVKTVMDLKDTADTVDLGIFKKSIESEAQAFYNVGKGSTKNINVQLSGNVKFVCFTDPKESISDSTCKYKQSDGSLAPCKGGLDGVNNNDDAFSLLLRNEEKKNMWFLPLGSARVDSFEIRFIEPTKDANPICYPNGRKVTLEAQGSYVELK